MQDSWTIDHKRGCGWRKPGGLYFVTSGLSAPCGKLPVPLDVCPTCAAGIKFCRGWTWINPRPLVTHRLCQNNSTRLCHACPFDNATPERAGLIWIGEQFYPTPQAWEREAEELGICRRIRSVPRDFVLGQTWICVAHRKGIKRRSPGTNLVELAPAIFHAFRPTVIEYVMRGDESQSELDAMTKRKIKPIIVQHAEPQQGIFT